jgi:hypothetical protein
MRLIRIRHFLDQYFEENSRPSPAAIKRWPCAVKPGGEWFVDLDKFQSIAEQQTELNEILEDSDIAEALK